MPLQFHRAVPPTAVTVEAPARLHLGFLDPNASLGRAFGSLGLVIDGPSTLLEARRAERDGIEGAASQAQHDRVALYLDRLHAAYGPTPVAIDLRRQPRAHAGFGSGTQLALALGTAFARLLGHTATSAELAALLGRGARSGIGILGFECGGLLLDGGIADQPQASPPPLLSRQAFPEPWRVLLVEDTSRQGLHGEAERRGLAALAPFPRKLAAHLCHLVLMQILPAAAQSDFAPFAHGIGELQQIIGEYFAPVQGGVFASPAVERVLRAVAAQHDTGIGQTSWGPTGFAVLPSPQHALRALATARQAAQGQPQLETRLVAGRNRGATIACADAAPKRHSDAA